MQPRERLFEMLTEEAQHAVPLSFRFVQNVAPAQPSTPRFVESTPYRSKGYACGSFYKPISRCFGLPPED